MSPQIRSKARVDLAAAVLSGFSLVLALAGCSEHFDRRDALTRASGNAVALNVATQSTTPWPPGVGRRYHHTDGRKVQIAMEKYHDVGKNKEATEQKMSAADHAATPPDSGNGAP